MARTLPPATFVGPLLGFHVSLGSVTPEIAAAQARLAKRNVKGFLSGTPRPSTGVLVPRGGMGKKKKVAAAGLASRN